MVSELSSWCAVCDGRDGRVSDRCSLVAVVTRACG